MGETPSTSCNKKLTAVTNTLKPSHMHDGFFQESKISIFEQISEEIRQGASK